MFDEMKFYFSESKEFPKHPVGGGRGYFASMNNMYFGYYFTKYIYECSNGKKITIFTSKHKILKGILF